MKLGHFFNLNSKKKACHIANLTHSLTGYVNVGLTLYDSNFTKSWNGNKDIIQTAFHTKNQLKLKHIFKGYRGVD